jgi:hypothetical protein
MLVANSVIIAVIGAMLSGGNLDLIPPLIVSLAVLGFVLCIAWILITARGFGYLTYWYRCAIELENYLGDGVKTFSRFSSLRAGEEVTFNDVDESDRVRLYRLSTWSRASQRIGAYMIVAVYAIAYILFATLGILQLP